MRSIHILFLAVVAILTAGCAGGGIEKDPAILNQIEQLQLAPGMTRDEVAVRLGNPDVVYEQDSVISYYLYEQHGDVVVKLPKGRSNVLHLMLLFSPDWRLERFSIINRPY